MALDRDIDRTRRRSITFYSGVIIAALSLTSPANGVFIIPLSFLLKNKLHLSANGLATFAALVSIPGYLSFAFGIVRDFWSPFGMGDRGYFVLFGGVSAVLFAVCAVLPVSVSMLFVAAILITIAYLFMWGGWNGLASMIGQHYAMSGHMSAIWNFAGTAATVAALVLGGVLSDRLEGDTLGGAVSALFLLASVVMTSVAALGFWKPAAVFAGLRRDRGTRQDFLSDLARLARHWPIYPSLAIWLLRNFSPGTQTVLQYYMSNTLHASDTQWGAYNAIANAASVPTFLLFGYLSSRYSLATLLWVGTLAGIPQLVPLLFIHTATGVLVSAVPSGLMGGLATAAYMDLLIRVCPEGLEGTLMMMAWSMYALASSVGDVWGTYLYDRHGGFAVCVLAATAVYALILPAILLLPGKLVSGTDRASA